MPGALEEFLQQFAGGAAPQNVDPAQYHDRFASTHENDRDFDNAAYHKGAADYIGQLPDDQFHDAASNAIAQAPPEQRQDLLGTLLGALGGASGGRSGGGFGGAGGALGALGGIGGIAKMLGLGSTDPRNMSGDDAAKLMNYARKEHPEALRQTVQEKPWFVKALGNPIVMGALTMAATQLLNSRRRS
jgi:hypothetical protein